MPMPYSHLALASYIARKSHINITDEFYLGSVIPDVRYFTGEPRDTYHFSINHLNEISQQHPSSESFVIGYGIHLIIDETWADKNIRSIYKKQFPRILQSRINIRIMEVLLELFCLQHRAVPEANIIPSPNGITDALNLNPSGNLAKAASTLQEYVKSRSLQTAVSAAENSGKYTADRLKQIKIISKLTEISIIRILIHLITSSATTYMFQDMADRTALRLPEIRANAR